MADNTSAAIALDEAHGKILLSTAAHTLAGALFRDEISYPDPEHFEAPLSQPGASFVTYEHSNQLVGCIGSIEPELPLILDASRNALLAAFADPRTPGITAVPLEETSMKISVLSEAEKIEASSLEEAMTAIRPGIDGLLVESEGRRGTLLPAVWEKVDSVEEFLDILWKKAGLPLRHFDKGVRLSRYRTAEFSHPNVYQLIEQGSSWNRQERFERNSRLG